MSAQHSILGIILLLSAIIVLYLAIYSLKKRSSNLYFYFSLLTFSVFFWCLGSAMEFFSAAMWAKIFWIKISYIGVATAAPLWFILILEYGHYEKYIKPAYIGTLMLLPLVIITLAFTNDFHGFIWPSITPISDAAGALLIYAHGLGYWINIGYSFILIILGLVILLKLLMKSPRIYHNQILILMSSGLIPLIFSILYNTDIIGVPGLDITPFGLTISGLLIAVSIFKFSLLGIRPIAYETLFNTIKNGFMVFDKDDKLIDVNPAAEMIGINTDDVGRQVTELLNNLPELKKFYQDSDEEAVVFAGDPFNIWIRIQSTLLYDKNQFRGRLITIQDISKLKRVEKDYSDSEERYKNLSELSPDAILVVIGEEIVFANKASATIFGLEDPKDLLGKNFFTFHHPDSRETAKKRLKEVFSEGRFLDFIEEKIIASDGKLKDIEVGDAPISYNGKQAVQIVARDISERKKLEEELKNSLKEKDLMMKEIHHRVKNNLMVIQSLLNLQSRYIKDTDARDIFKDSQNRAKAMAMIHESLYKSSDLKRIEFSEYINTLANNLFYSYAADPKQLKMDINVEEIMLDINTAIPLGLILTELLSNCLKYAFPDDKNGEIKVDFYSYTENSENKLKLTVSDNGVGLPEGFDPKKSDSLGLTLVYSLAGQINATVTLDTTTGTTFEITFEEKMEY
ncbi:histidine kinase N-terminal 7TM domain-containing protein [Methanobacterium ferruginis]|uniref:histidine kinase N-terminal 7TM domain-containing protein n=1 Tax=Methanobacterium ferruginis TaxID=710191 RepID=UPI002573F512|nr:histidine kinase N-terminal 7TM domain-containing protein [Methanobacterium ferruginis]